MRRLSIILAGLTALGLGIVGVFWWIQSSRPEVLLARGQRAIQRGQLNDAKAIAGRLAAEGYLDHSHLLLGQLIFSRVRPGGDSEELSQENRLCCHQALKEWNQIKDQGELRLQAAILTGQCLLTLKQYSEAERAFHFVLSERPDQVDAHRGLAAVYYDLGTLDHAANHLQHVARLAPNDGRPHRLLGLIHKDLEHPDQAVIHYREALRRQLNEGMVQEVRVELAEVLVRLSKYADALEAIEGSKPAAEDIGKAVALRAECFWGLGKTGEAKSLLEEALTLNLRASEILRLRAKLHLEADEAKEAVPLLEEVLARDRHDHISRYQLVQALEKLDRTREATEQRALYEKTRQLLAEMSRLTNQAMDKPRDAGLRRQLAEACEQLDKHELAAMWHRAADALQPEPK